MLCVPLTVDAVPVQSLLVYDVMVHGTVGGGDGEQHVLPWYGGSKGHEGVHDAGLCSHVMLWVIAFTLACV